jgi:tetratricopeptide (TPR) repeat protein
MPEDRAISDYDKAIQLKPDYADTYYDRGIAYFNKGETQKAIADFRKVLELSANDSALCLDTRQSLQKLGV